ncbi:MAG: hypothetical protein NTY38_24835, partial [Acidobacteria bacterium]|nr:hypothetical protein [Acidobacteriota bacterium]
DQHLSWTPPQWNRQQPRVALYQPWTANIDTGWTQWLLDTYQIPYTLVHNDDIRKGGLRDRFDSILLASQTASSILHGTRAGEATTGRLAGSHAEPEPNSAQRPEYTGGIEVEGLARLDEFLKAGGTVIALDQATEIAGYFPAGIRPLLRAAPAEGAEPASTGYDCPGSLIRIDLEPNEPIAAGMPPQAIAFSNGGQAWDITLLPEFNHGQREVRVIARYAKTNLLASGWISGEKGVLGKPALVEARVGPGRLILFGFRPQHRGQTFGTFKLLLNAVYLASAR